MFLDEFLYFLSDKITYQLHVWKTSSNKLKWLMLLPLFIVLILIFIIYIVDKLQSCMSCCGECCLGTGNAMGSTKTTYYINNQKSHSETEHHGTCCLCFGCLFSLISITLFLSLIILVLIAFLFYGLSFVWLLKDENAVCEYVYTASDEFGKNLYRNTSPYGKSCGIYKSNTILSKVIINNHLRNKGLYLLISDGDNIFWQFSKEIAPIGSDFNEDNVVQTNLSTEIGQSANNNIIPNDNIKNNNENDIKIEITNNT